MRKDNVIMYISTFAFSGLGFLVGAYWKELYNNYQSIVVLATFIITVINFQNSRIDRREKIILEHNRKKEIIKVYQISLIVMGEIIERREKTETFGEDLLKSVKILKVNTSFIIKYSKSIDLIRWFDYVMLMLDRLEDYCVNYNDNNSELQAKIKHELSGFQPVVEIIRNIKNVY